jgi:hypothetical protein
VYMATIFAVFKDYPCRKRGDGVSMDGESCGGALVDAALARSSLRKRRWGLGAMWLTDCG